MQIQRAFEPVVKELLQASENVISRCKSIIADLLDNSDIDRKIAKLQVDREKAKTQVEALIAQRARPIPGADEEARQKVFVAQYDDLKVRLTKLEEKIAALETEKSDRIYRARQAEVFMENLKAETNDPNDAEESIWHEEGLFIALVDKVMIAGDKKGPVFTFVMRDGTVRPDSPEAIIDMGNNQRTSVDPEGR